MKNVVRKIHKLNAFSGGLYSLVVHSVKWNIEFNITFFCVRSQSVEKFLWLLWVSCILMRTYAKYKIMNENEKNHEPQ